MVVDPTAEGRDVRAKLRPIAAPSPRPSHPWEEIMDRGASARAARASAEAGAFYAGTA
jgi:hypothetical protein